MGAPTGTRRDNRGPQHFWQEQEGLGGARGTWVGLETKQHQALYSVFGGEPEVLRGRLKRHPPPEDSKGDDRRQLLKTDRVAQLESTWA